MTKPKPPAPPCAPDPGFILTFGHLPGINREARASIALDRDPRCQTLIRRAISDCPKLTAGQYCDDHLPEREQCEARAVHMYVTPTGPKGLCAAHAPVPKSPAAVALGTRGGLAKSPAKALSSAANGKLRGLVNPTIDELHAAAAALRSLPKFANDPWERLAAYLEKKADQRAKGKRI